VSSLLLSQLRATDVAGRYGGEEIIVVLAQSGLEGAELLANRWRGAVEETVFHTPDGDPVKVTISMGLAGYTPAVKSPDDLVSAADAALYRAKKAGRNQVAVAESKPDVADES
jgi:diguanylate cyclase (GGDEF)-like protein